LLTALLARVNREGWLLTRVRPLGDGRQVSWAGRLVDLFEDLEQQAAGLALQARDAEVAELGRAQYAEVDLLGRLHATLGRSVRLELRGAGRVTGRLLRVGRGWVLVAPEVPPGQEWLVNLEATLEARGLSARATVEAARGLATKVSIGSALRHLAEVVSVGWEPTSWSWAGTAGRRQVSWASCRSPRSRC
jgi:hypothetical protein